MDSDIKYYREKELQAIEGKIYTTKQEGNFFIKNIIKVVLFGLAFSILGPLYKGRTNEYSRKTASSLQDALGISYLATVIVIAVVYTTVCVLGHFIWKYQDNKKIERLLNRKKEIEQELGIQN